MIKAEQLTKHYRRLVAVDNVNLEIPKGCVFGLIGPNGAGKTTLIKMLMGLTKITAGRANIIGIKRGRPIRSDSARGWAMCLRRTLSIAGCG